MTPLSGMMMMYPDSGLHPLPAWIGDRFHNPSVPRRCRTNHTVCIPSPPSDPAALERRTKLRLLLLLLRR